MPKQYEDHVTGEDGIDRHPAFGAPQYPDVPAAAHALLAEGWAVWNGYQSVSPGLSHDHQAAGPDGERLWFTHLHGNGRTPHDHHPLNKADVVIGGWPPHLHQDLAFLIRHGMASRTADVVRRLRAQVEAEEAGS